ncbi:Alpha-tubulin [Reticulomyxa filosa]|uniref:Tubulin alpha chain n=1 Tax=Reticulomyxa filosa TaxID=46433 RepID=X6MFX9_RETFI|nr:Alpha-tubulin [Reticulomyxa filosa]|eukprot:ETO12898.1 Alpha-tubulin [Reticulomyxa filosa]
MKTGRFSSLWNHEFLLSGKQDASNNFARGYHAVGKQMIDKVNDGIRKWAEKCDDLEGFMVSHSVGGGTGSGLGSLILEQLGENYKKNLSTCVIEPYNALLTTHCLLDNIEMSLVFENEAIYNICKNKLLIAKPDVNHLNSLIAKVISGVNSSNRGDSFNLNSLCTDLCYAQIHFITTGMAPILPKADITVNVPDDLDIITIDCFEPSNWFVQYTEFDPEKEKCTGLRVVHRANVYGRDSSAAFFRCRSKYSLVDWPPTCRSCTLDQTPIAILETDDIAKFSKSTVLLANNTGIRTFIKQITKQFDYMYSQKAFVHWYTKEGIEEYELANAREELEFLQKNYFEISSIANDEYSDND